MLKYHCKISVNLVTESSKGDKVSGILVEQYMLFIIAVDKSV